MGTNKILRGIHRTLTVDDCARAVADVRWRWVVYVRGTRRLQQLELRSTGYRFDLDLDPTWERVTEPGVHAPSALLADFGVDVAAVAPHAATFDWVFAASVCRSFVLLEECVVEFIARERDSILGSASLESLVVEEEKHIEMFRRYEELLLAQRDRASFDRWFAPMGKRLRERHAERLWSIPDPASRHWVFWMNTLFFEEFTLYLDERLQETTGVQPTWLQVHRLHRIEETQHCATDEGYLESLGLDEQKADGMSKLFVFGLLQHLHDTVAISAAVEAMKELAGVTVVASGGVTKLPFVRHVLTRPAFRRSRAFAPYLRELAQQQAS